MPSTNAFGSTQPAETRLVVPEPPLVDGIGGEVGDVEARRLVVGARDASCADCSSLIAPAITSAPRMYGRSAVGIATLPSGWRWFSTIAAHTRGTASAEPLSVLAMLRALLAGAR